VGRENENGVDLVGSDGVLTGLTKQMLKGLSQAEVDRAPEA
jgi:hypothetical protein